MKINLGSGVDYKEGWVNVDNKDIKCDAKHDLRVFPYPFKDNCADIIELNSVLEHFPVELQQDCIIECNRILKKGGKLIVRVPHFTGFHAFKDIEHHRPYTSHTFDGFVVGKEEGSMNDYYGRKKFSDIKVRIVFGKGIQIWNHLFEWFVNLNQLTQDIYEQSFLSANPAEGIRVELTK